MRGNDLDAFNILAEIVARGSFKKAAEALHKTVPAISYSVSQLEKRYGLNLVDRSSYRATLTDHGVRLLNEARKVMAQAEYLDSVAAQLLDDWEPSLEVIIDGMLDPRFVLDTIQALKAEGVSTTFQLTTEYLGGVEKRFQQNRADIMFTLNYTANEQWHCVNLFDIDVMLVASPHLLSDRKTTYELNDLTRYLEVSVKDSSFTDPVPGRSLGGLDMFFVGDFYTKKQAILRGMGLGWMPTTWIKEELASGNLVEVPYSGGARDRYKLWLGTWKTSAAGKAQTRFILNVKTSLQQAVNHSSAK